MRSTTAPYSGRNSTLEILRIVCMFLIVAYHLVGGTEQFLEFPPPFSANVVFYYSIGLWGQAAVLCFLLITGYFMIGTRIKLSKILSLAIEVWFYSIIIGAIMIGLGIIDVNYDTLRHIFFPILNRDYWFISDFIIVMLLSPILNKTVENISKKEFQYVLIVLTITSFFISELSQREWLGAVPMLILSYLIGGYIKLHPSRISESKCVPAITLIASVAVSLSLMCMMECGYRDGQPLLDLANHSSLLIFTAISIAVVSFVTICTRDIRAVGATMIATLVIAYFVLLPYYGLGIRSFMEERLSILVGLTAISLFLLFKNSKETHCRWINVLSSGTLAIYLIHNNLEFGPVLWERLIQPDILTHEYAPLEIIGILCGIVLACLLIDLMRQAIFKAVSSIETVRKRKIALNNWFDGIFEKTDEGDRT